MLVSGVHPSDSIIQVMCLFFFKLFPHSGCFRMPSTALRRPFQLIDSPPTVFRAHPPSSGPIYRLQGPSTVFRAHLPSSGPIHCLQDPPAVFRAHLLSSGPIRCLQGPSSVFRAHPLLDPLTAVFTSTVLVLSFKICIWLFLYLPFLFPLSYTEV